MRCPFCRVDNDKVIDSRGSEDGLSIRRRRECLKCKRRYTTYERVEEMEIKVVKKDAVRETFDRDKIKRGLEKACWKRPISPEQIDRLVSLVEGDIYANFDSEIETRELGEMVMDRLAELDQVAYVRFASVYREFKDVRDFVDELQPMLRKPRPLPLEEPAESSGAAKVDPHSKESPESSEPSAKPASPRRAARPAAKKKPRPAAYNDEPLLANIRDEVDEKPGERK
jgi:transcriptional repressor NrdR